MEKKNKFVETFHEVFDKDGVSYFDSSTMKIFTKKGALEYFKDLNSVAIVNFFLFDDVDKENNKNATKFVREE